jgi:endonuclease/exonuclease/phosphatase family metal-dependent hydrolase
MDLDSPWGDLLETRLRVMTWNLWWRFGPFEERQPLIAAAIARVDPDIVCLQEVWEEQAAALAGELGYSHVYSSRFPRGDFLFGNAVLSRWPIGRSEWRPLPAPEKYEELRTVLFAEVDGPRGPVQIFCTHLHWRFDHSHIRQEQVALVAQFVADCRPRTFPPIVCGDLNADPESDEIRMLTGRAATPIEGLSFHDAWEAAGAGTPGSRIDGATWSNANPFAALGLEPDRRIDYVLVGWPKARGAGHVTHCRVEGTELTGGVTPSDHYAVVAELRY